MAFDSIDHNYMQAVLETYGFGHKCKNWFKLLNKNLKANILVNCFTTESIKIEQLVKLGNALSCSLFIQYSGFTPGTPVLTQYTPARKRYSPPRNGDEG